MGRNVGSNHYHYQDSANYGGPKLEVTKLKPTAINHISAKIIELEVPGLKAGGQVYELKLDLQDTSGNPLWADTYCYTANRLRTP